MKSKGLFQPLALGTVLALGFLAAWAIVAIEAYETSVMIAIRNGAGDSLMIRADGTALISHYEEGVASYRDLSGAPVAIPEDDPIGRLQGAELPPSLPWRKEDSDWDQRIRFFSDGRSPYTAWHFISDGQADGTAYLVGYDDYTKAKIGYLGTAGFRVETPLLEEHFPFAGAISGLRSRVICPGQDRQRHHVSVSQGVYRIDQWGATTPWVVYVLGLDEKVYEINLRKRAVRVVVHESGLRSLSGIDDITDTTHSNWRLAVRTDKDVLVLDKHGKEQQRYPIPEELREKAFTFGETTTNEAVMYWNKERDMMDTEAVCRLFWVRPDGLHRTAGLTVPFHQGYDSLRFCAAALIPAPLALDIAGFIRSQGLHDDGLAPTLSSAVVRTLAQFWPALAITQLLAFGFAILCYRRQVRYGVSRAERIVWPLFVLMLGLPGWIGYRFGRSWPVLETCPECFVDVPRDRERCVRCTNDFPRPALKGTEVFA